MVTSVYTVDVDDEPFKEFAALFQKHTAELKAAGDLWAKSVKGADRMSEAVAEATEAVKEQEKAWGASEKIVDSITSGMRGMTAALMAQATMMAKERQEQEDSRREEGKADKKRLDAIRQEKQAMEERKKASAKLVSDAKSIAGSFLGATVSIMKWATLGGLGGLVGSGFGLATMADRIGDAYRTSSGLGVTTGQQQAIGLSYGRYADTNAGLQSILEAQTDPSRRWAFSAMGVKPDGKDNGELYIETLHRAKTMFDSYMATNPMTAQSMAQAHGLMQGGAGFSINDLMRLHKMSPGDMKDADSRAAKYQRELALQDDVQKKWQDFSIKIKEFTLHIQTILAPALDKLLDPLSKFADVMAEDLKAFTLDKNFQTNMDRFAKGIEDLAVYLGSDDFKVQLHKFLDGVGLVADEIMVVAEKLKWLVHKDASGAPSDPGSQAAAASAVGSVGGAAQAGVSNTAMKWFMARGWGAGGSAGIVGNVSAESNFNPFAQGDKNKKTGKFDAYGIGQWHKDRQDDYTKWIGHTMQSVRDPAQALGEQMAFIDYELRQKYKKVGDKIKNEDAYSAGFDVSKGYERPKDDAYNTQAGYRGRKAEVSLTVFNNTGGSSSVSVNQMPKP